MRNPKRWLPIATLALVVAVVAVLAAGARAQQGRLISLSADATAGAASESLEAPTAPPEAAFVQKVDHPHGNVLVSIQLSPEQVELKRQDGPADFILIGEGEHQTVLRDDGRDVDATAGDGRFTGVATIDEAELAARADEDQATLAARGSSQVPEFAGRRFAGFVSAQPFDYAAFASGAEVEIDTAVNFLSGGGTVEDAEPREAEPTSPTSPTTGAATIGVAPGGKRAPRAITAANVTLGTNQFQDRVLMIRHPGVVQDPLRTWNPCTGAGNQHGVWTFKHLMTEMANQPKSGIDPAVFVEDWLSTWTENPGPTINDSTVSTRTQMQSLIDQWKAGGTKLDLRRAPLRLLAIVPRVDLATTTGGGGYSGAASGNFLDAGELRFVFGVVLPPGFSGAGFLGAQPIEGRPGDPYNTTGGDDRTCRSLPFSVIFEYKVPKCDCVDVRAWARRLRALDGFVPGTSSYNTRLAALTQTVVRRDADPRRPNGSSLGQLRTNEIALPQDNPALDPANPPPPFPQDIRWELREFQLTQKPFSLLEETTTADTAADPFNFTLTFQSWVLNNVRPAILADFDGPIPAVPLFFQGAPFLGPNPQVPDPDIVNQNLADIEHHWDGVNMDLLHIPTNEARHRASLATCNACHRGETGTPFVHVDPSSPTLPATISGFLSGINDWPDPAASIPLRDFDDLARREIDIQDVADMTCGRFPLIDHVRVAAHLQQFGVLPDDPFVPHHEPGHGLSVSVDAMRRNIISEVH